jgi:hypothetical protein
VVVGSLANCGDDGGGTATEGTEAGRETDPEAVAVRVELPDYPFFDGTVIEPAPELLDELAADYATERGDQPLEMPVFLYGDVPVVAFDRIFAEAAEDVPAEQLLWLFYISGYFGGVWLRQEIAAAQPDAALTTFSDPLDRAGFEEIADRAREGLDAAAGDDDAVIAYNEQSLYDQPNPDNPEMPLRGLVDNFGYNQGYLLQILEVPPADLATSDRFQISCGGPLSCSYNTQRLAALDEVKPVERDLADGTTPEYAALAAAILPIQDAAVPRGRRVWSGDPGLSVEGFSQQSYDQLLDVSSSYLEEVQTTALAAVKAQAEGAVELGRQAALANASIGVWIGAYFAGITDGRPDRRQPTFVEA